MTPAAIVPRLKTAFLVGVAFAVIDIQGVMLERMPVARDRLSFERADSAPSQRSKS
jgi:hypothetical protein